jgi:hypothetical protein
MLVVNVSYHQSCQQASQSCDLVLFECARIQAWSVKPGTSLCLAHSRNKPRIGFLVDNSSYQVRRGNWRFTTSYIPEGYTSTLYDSIY